MRKEREEMEREREERVIERNGEGRTVQKRKGVIRVHIAGEEKTANNNELHSNCFNFTARRII